MKNSRISKTALVAAAVTLTASLSVGSALAYFTTYCRAEGSYEMSMGFPVTEITERVDKGKFVTIENTSAYDCYVRVKVFAPKDIMETITIKSGNASEPETVAAGEWIQFPNMGEWDDDYWYFNSILGPGRTTPELKISYELPGEEDEDRPNEINIVVVHECTPVLYDEDGNPYADWENIAAVGESTETVAEPGTVEDGDMTETEQEGE